MPSPNSLETLDPHGVVGCRVWGLNNREAPLRLCTDAHGEPNNAEYKTLDATANPYLALAVLIIAGLEVWDPILPEGSSRYGSSRGGDRIRSTRSASEFGLLLQCCAWLP